MGAQHWATRSSKKAAREGSSGCGHRLGSRANIGLSARSAGPAQRPSGWRRKARRSRSSEALGASPMKTGSTP
eukprot:6265616-Alexandrium_andersonii.AAC.2